MEEYSEKFPKESLRISVKNIDEFQMKPLVKFLNESLEGFMKKNLEKYPKGSVGDI